MAKKRSDWYPDGRHKQLDLAKKWISVFSEPAEGQGTKKNWQAWGIPRETFDAFVKACDNAEKALDAVITSGTRGGPLNAAVQSAFTELERRHRDIKRRYVFSPPISSAHLKALDVKQRDTSHTPKPAPKHIVTVKASNPELHEILLSILSGLFEDEDVSNFTFNIRMGILSPDGSVPERSSNAQYYMTKVPLIPEDLPGQFNRRRKKERFMFTAAEAGKTAYFSICYQNSKGETGPWSPIIAVIIT